MGVRWTVNLSLLKTVSTWLKMTVVSSFAVIMATYSKGYSIFKIYYTTNYKIKPVAPPLFSSFRRETCAEVLKVILQRNFFIKKDPITSVKKGGFPQKSQLSPFNLLFKV